MVGDALRRYWETFLRHPALYLLPLVVMLPAVLIASNSAVRNLAPYTATATVAVNLDPARQRPVGELPPAQQYTELLGELMETDEFILGALGQTRMAPALSNGSGDQSFAIAELVDVPADPLSFIPGRGGPAGPSLQPGERLDDAAIVKAVRNRWKQKAAGANTLNAQFRCREAAFCTEFVSAVLNTFRTQVAGARQSSKAATAAFYRQQLQAAQERLQALPPTDAARDVALQAYQALLNKTIEASLDEALEAQGGQETFKIISPPHIAGPPISPLRAVLPALLLGGLTGLGLSLGGVAVATWVEPRVYSPADLRAQVGLRPVTTVPPQQWDEQSVRDGGGAARQASRPGTDSGPTGWDSSVESGSGDG